MLSCAEQVQIQNYETHAYKTLKTVGVQKSCLKIELSIKNTKKHKDKIPYQRTEKNLIHINL